MKLLINNNIATITMDNDALRYKIGDEILVSTKAFNPIVFKVWDSNKDCQIAL